ncbi:hypothetical protein EVAR_17869_1 [Eumeta japonica]|uniref:Uncharacterized protein n=1 Tax=Eumeta variegata TaxID=151549 RepID=A0A4C1ZIV1_EUMVA|nr:hypothetical protein EVAR_17869_1 [Eumeta japonica]
MTSHPVVAARPRDRKHLPRMRRYRVNVPYRPSAWTLTRIPMADSYPAARPSPKTTHFRLITFYRVGARLAHFNVPSINIEPHYVIDDNLSVNALSVVTDEDTSKYKKVTTTESGKSLVSES